MGLNTSKPKGAAPKCRSYVTDTFAGEFATDFDPALM